MIHPNFQLHLEQDFFVFFMIFFYKMFNKGFCADTIMTSQPSSSSCFPKKNITLTRHDFFACGITLSPSVIGVSLMELETKTLEKVLKMGECRN